MTGGAGLVVQWGERDGEREEVVVYSGQAPPLEHWFVGEHSFPLHTGGGGGQLQVLPWSRKEALREGLSLRCDLACIEGTAVTCGGVCTHHTPLYEQTSCNVPGCPVCQLITAHEVLQHVLVR